MRSGHYSKHAVRASLLHFIFGRSAAAVVALCLLLILVRALSGADYGFYITLLSLLEVVQIASSFGLILAAQRYIPELRAADRNAALRAIVVKLLALRAVTLAAVLLVCFFASDYIAGFFGVAAQPQIVLIYLFIIFFEGLARYIEVCQDSLLRQKSSQLAVLIRTSMRLLLLAALYFSSDDGVVALVCWLWIDLTASVAGCAYGAASLMRFVARLPQAADEASKSERWRMFSYVAPAFLAQLLYTSWGPDSVKLVAARLVGATQVAAFGFAAAFSAMLQRYLPTFLLMNLIRPLFVAARNRDDYQQRLAFMAGLIFKLNAFALAPIGAVLIVTNRPLTELLTGGKLPEAGSYLVFFVIVLLLQSLRGVVSLLSQALELGRASLIGAAAGTLGLGAGALLTPVVGLAALCLGLVLSEALFVACQMVAMRGRGVRFPFDAGGMARIVLVACVASLAAAFAVSAATALPPAGEVLVGACVCVVVYLALCRLWRPFKSGERELINGILKRNVFCW